MPHKERYALVNELLEGLFVFKDVYFICVYVSAYHTVYDCGIINAVSFNIDY